MSVEDERIWKSVREFAVEEIVKSSIILLIFNRFEDLMFTVMHLIPGIHRNRAQMNLQPEKVEQLIMDGMYYKIGHVDAQDVNEAIRTTSTDHDWVNKAGVIVNLHMRQCRPTDIGDVLYNDDTNELTIIRHLPGTPT